MLRGNAEQSVVPPLSREHATALRVPSVSDLAKQRNPLQLPIALAGHSLVTEPGEERNRQDANNLLATSGGCASRTTDDKKATDIATLLHHWMLNGKPGAKNAN